ncbi:MAG: hypothetical protein OEQ13_02505 [Acidobacteriota bacterium]|nr:hypothetical protein [Acidobacteriota bacterium]
MDEARAAGRRFWCALPGPELQPGTERALADLLPAGIILFDRNLASAAQTRDLVAGVRETVAAPISIGIDQEGGSVNRLLRLDESFGLLPPARLQATWPVDRLERAWRAVGTCLASLGIDVDFAPVVDLDASEGTNAIGPRSYGAAAGDVIARAGSVLRGLDGAGVAGCLKHFPGLGDTTVDTHLALAVSPVASDVLWDLHAHPYRELAGEAPLVMTAHAHFPSVDGPDPLPATFSRRLVHGWLRERIGYDGLVVTDDLEMGAVSTSGSPGERAIRALQAGCDLVLFCKSLDAPRHARDAVAARIVRGDLDRVRLAESDDRLARLHDRTSTSRGVGGGAEEFERACRELEARLA